MAMRALRISIALATLLTLTGAPAGAESSGSWILTLIHVETPAQEIRIEGEFHGWWDGSQPVAYGSGIGDGSFGFVRVDTDWSGSTRVSTTEGAGGVDVTTVDGRAGELFLHSRVSWGGDFEAGSVLAVLKFLTGATLDGTFEQPTAASGSLRLEVVEGSGSEVIRAVDPEADGTAIGVGSVAAGQASIGRDVTRGIAGGFVLSFCASCEASWYSADGREGHVEMGGVDAVLFASYFGLGEITFGGPAGAWRWDWVGHGRSRELLAVPIIGAYAPIGDAWPLFSNE